MRSRLTRAEVVLLPNKKPLRVNDSPSTTPVPPWHPQRSTTAAALSGLMQRILEEGVDWLEDDLTLQAWAQAQNGSDGTAVDGGVDGVAEGGGDDRTGERARRSGDGEITPELVGIGSGETKKKKKNFLVKVAKMQLLKVFLMPLSNTKKKLKAIKKST